MRDFFRGSLSLYFLLGASALYATNGDNLIATGAKSRGMGGIGIAKSFGAESALSNPALLSSVKEMEMAGSLSFFSPDVAYASDTLNKANPSASNDLSFSDSNDDMNVIPEVAFAQRITDKLLYGVAVTGTASMGVDYSEENPSSTLGMKTDLQLLKLAIAFSYAENGLSLGFSPVMQFGTLEMSHIVADPSDLSQFTLLDNGPASDVGYGYTLGAAYDFEQAGIEGLSLGFVYKSKIKMQYNNTLSASVAAFDAIASTGITSGDSLDQPAEFGLGLSYDVDAHSFAFDFKRLAWGSAAGFRDFGWEDQNVFALGYAYRYEEWTFRGGYNYASSPIKEQDGLSYGGAIKNSFNLAGFPGIIEEHYTLGSSYIVSDEVELDLAFVFASEASESFNTTGVTQVFGQALDPSFDPNVSSRADVSHSQFALTLGARYQF